jgi:uncharacterized protein YecE (DUF72 family)
VNARVLAHEASTKPRVFVATAGWAVPREHASLVTREGTGLQRYSSVLGATEINSTFYRRHQPKTFERWRDSVGTFFRFAVKLPRSITHEAALASPREALAQFFDDVSALGDKLGPILVQLPASADFDRRRAGLFFRALRARYSGLVACEPRHAGWYTPAASGLFVDYDVARVVADPARPLDARQPGGSDSLRYTRWHGSPRTYWSPYSDADLLTLADSTLRAPVHSAVWCVFDNTASGSALNDAHRFQVMLEKRMKRGAKTASG